MEKAENREGIAVCRTYSRRVADAMAQTLTDMRLEPSVGRCAFGYEVTLPEVPADGEAITLHISQRGRTEGLCEFCLPQRDLTVGFEPSAACTGFVARARARQHRQQEAVA